MCEYINHLDKFKKYKYPCKRKTNKILNSKDSLTILLECINLSTLDSTTLYIFYRTNDSISNTIRLNAKKEKHNIKRLEDLKKSIIDGSEGYLEVYIFNNENTHDKKHFDKLYKLINEFCDVDKLNVDYVVNFTPDIIKLVVSFLISSYDSIKKLYLIIIGLLFTDLIISIYKVLLTHGYPYELIDYSSIVLLTKFYFLSLKWIILILIGSITIGALLQKVGETNKEGEKNYKIFFSLTFYIFTIIIGYFTIVGHNEDTYLKNYNKIHIFPRLIQENNITSLVIYKKRKTIYSYALDNLMNKKTIKEICEVSSSNTNATLLMSSIMYKSSNFKNITIKDISNNIIFLDENTAKELILNTYCPSEEYISIHNDTDTEQSKQPHL